jgi:Tfp pilus assembly protein PilN
VALALVQAARALRALRDVPTIIMDIAAQRTTLVLVEAGAVVYARDVTIGDDHLTEALTGQVVGGGATFSISKQEAEQLKRSVGVPDLQPGALVGAQRIQVETYRAMIQPVLEQLASEARRTIASGSQALRADAPGRVIISGVGSRLPRIDAWLTQQLGLPVEQLDCAPLVGTEGSAAAVACGLAAFNRPPALDLQPPAAHHRRLTLRVASRAWQVLAALVLVVWLGAGWWWAKGNRARHALQPVRARLQQLQPVQELRVAVDTRAQLVEQLTTEESLSLGWFRRLASEMPAAVRLTKLFVDRERRVELTGLAQERDQSPEGAISELTLSLEDTSLCRNPQLASTRRIGQNGDLVEFTLTCQAI